MVARESGHKPAHVLALFADPEPNTSLRLFLDLVEAAGARLAGVDENSPRAVVARLAAIARENDISVSSLARISGVSRPQLSTLFNDADPNPKLAMIDSLVTALGAEQEFQPVAADGTGVAAGDEDELEAEDEGDDDDLGDEDEAGDVGDEEEDDEDADEEEEEDEDDEDADEDDQADENDPDEGDEDEVEPPTIQALRERTALFERRLLEQEAEIRRLKTKQESEGVMSKVLTGGLIGLGVAGLAALVWKPRKE